MRRILVINSKGGCGKTTVATNLASLYASRGLRTSLFDYDPQESSYSWLEQRPVELPRIHGVSAHQRLPVGLTRSWYLRVPPETERLILDTAASLDKPQMLEYIKSADLILVPIVPAAIDARAAIGFIKELLSVRKYGCARIGIIINRVREENQRLIELERAVEDLELPLVARLRDNNSYLTASERGVGLHELDADDADVELPNWQHILRWLESDASLVLPIRRRPQASHA